MKCQNCHSRPATNPAIINSKYGRYCPPCIQENTARLPQTSTAQWHRDRDIEDHRKDMLQPRDIKGTPQGEFIRAYPEESKEIFTQEEIEKHG